VPTSFLNSLIVASLRNPSLLRLVSMFARGSELRLRHVQVPAELLSGGGALFAAYVVVTALAKVLPLKPYHAWLTAMASVLVTMGHAASTAVAFVVSKAAGQGARPVVALQGLVIPRLPRLGWKVRPQWLRWRFGQIRARPLPVRVDPSAQ
jgi:hypothetical protein